MKTRQRLCKDCNKPLPQDSAPQRRRCEPCAATAQSGWIDDWHKRNRDQLYAAAERKRRSRGVRPKAEVDAKRRAQALQRLAKIQPLLDKGLSWRKAAKKLGISHNVIAGLKHKARIWQQEAR